MAESIKHTTDLTGVEKASVLLISLGTDMTSNILQQLAPDEIERVTASIVKFKRVDPDVQKSVLEECRKTLHERSTCGGEDFAREVLQQVVGESKAKGMLSRLISGGGTGAFHSLRTVPPSQLAHVIKQERPQIVALVIGHLPPDHAAQVLALLPEQLQGEVVHRLTTMQPTDPEVIRNIDQALLQRLSAGDNQAFTEVGGNDSVVQLLNNVDRSAEKKILEYLESVDPKVADSIKEQMFVFEDIIKLDDRSIQIILRDVPQDDLRLALKGSNENVKETFFRNMSQRAAETLREDLEASGPVKLKDVEAAQGRIANIARQLDEAGEISLRGSGDELVV